MVLAEEKRYLRVRGKASVEEIEEHNIVGATCLAMMRAIDEVQEQVVGCGSRRKIHP